MTTPARLLAGCHAAYLFGTGIWPLVHRRSFEAVTGPKQDFWLARTVGGCAAAMGASLGAAVATGRRRPEAVVLALASAMVFVAADVRASLTESRTYLGDIAVQFAVVPAWLLPWEREPRVGLEGRLRGPRAISVGLFQSTSDF